MKYLAITINAPIDEFPEDIDLELRSLFNRLGYLAKCKCLVYKTNAEKNKLEINIDA